MTAKNADLPYPRKIYKSGCVRDDFVGHILHILHLTLDKLTLFMHFKPLPNFEIENLGFRAHKFDHMYGL